MSSWLPVLIACAVQILDAGTLADALRDTTVPTAQFTPAELTRKITSYAVSKSDPFLLAYYIDDGSKLLKAPLYVVRYRRGSKELQKTELRNCLGSALQIREEHGTIYINTHGGPAAGCVVMLSTDLSYRFAVSGWLLGTMGDDYAITAVHPLHINIYDLKRKLVNNLYPPKHSGLRDRFTEAIKPMVSEKWCTETNAPCDPRIFNTDLAGDVAVNDDARVLGFVARFDAGGFAADSGERIPTVEAAYVFREQNGMWEHREFLAKDIPNLFAVASLADLVHQKPLAAFKEPPVR